MNSTADICPICGSEVWIFGTRDYAHCFNCGHEVLARQVAGVEIVNDRLDRQHLERRNALDRFKDYVVRRCCGSKDFLLDVGSASGRFLYQQRDVFRRLIGVEVTPDCLQFSRLLGLQVEENLSELEGDISLATFWHSMEHIPASELDKLLAAIRAHATTDTTVVISVPNAASLQYRMLGPRFAYYDVPAHIHQFSPTSLDRLMARHGFRYVRSFRSVAYAGFGWLQGLLNLCDSRHNYYYYRSKRGWDFGLAPAVRMLRDWLNLLFILFLIIPAGILTLFDIIFPQQGGVVTRCYSITTGSK